MDNALRKVPLTKFDGPARQRTEDVVAREFSLTVVLNGREIVTLPCSPDDLDHLAIGYLVSEGHITGREKIKGISVDESSGTVRVETTGSGKTPPDEEIKADSAVTVSADEVFGLMERFIGRSEIFKATGGVHSCALCDTRDILVFKEDIGRNNAIDKLFGECILKDIPVSERMLVVSCRMSSDLLRKVALRKVPVIISKSPPTDRGVALAESAGITLLGFVRGNKMNAYTHDWRITDNGR